MQAASVALEDVCIVLPCLPAWCLRREWPVRLAAADSCEAAHVYLCGTVEEVRGLLERFTPLACFVDAEASLPLCEVLPELAHGLEAAWEPLLAAVCSRHVATIQQQILRTCQRSPERVALVYEQRQWTYRQLCSAACSLRDTLLAEGLLPSKGPVAVRLDASDHSAICFLALMAGGFTVHLLDRGEASQRYRLEACPSQAVLTAAGQDLVALGLPVFKVDEMQLDVTQAPESLHMSGDLNDVAFIEYTSGSTGAPKSVATVQWRIAHWARWHSFHFPPGSRDAYNLFWIWYWQIPLMTGSTCVVWPNWQSQDISQLMQYFRRHRVERCNCLTPGQLSTLLALEESLPEDLKEVFVGGEALPLSTCRSWLKKWPHVRLVVNYATTETAADMAFLPMTEQIACMEMPFAPLSTEIVCWNNEMRIENEELVISGWNVADGYLPPTASTAFGRERGQNVYRTGDRAVLLEGKLFIMGRVDKVVKVRGFRVDTDGVESLLMRAQGVRDVCVRKFGESLYAVLVASDLEEAKSFARENYEHARLLVWVQVDALPMTKSGKKDIAAIKQLLEDREKNEVMEYHSDEERRVAAAFQEVLGRAVARDTPFLEAGGHSLSAMRIGKLLGISPVELFKSPTIAALAEGLGAKTASRVVALPRSPQPSNRPLAVVGMACRLPNAGSPEHFFQSLQAGHLMTSELPGALPSQIPRKGVVPDLGFDCHFWRCTEQQAAMMEPAQRLLLENAYEAFHAADVRAKLPSGQLRGLELQQRNVAVMVCGGSLTHWPTRLGLELEDSRTKRPDEYFNLEVGADKDYLASSIAYRLDLHGTAEVIQTACSSALVAVSRAAQHLKADHCDYALCGGASFSPDAPILAVDGLIWAPDGLCKPYAEGANGTTNADGGGLVLLRRGGAAEGCLGWLLGSGTNNDGQRKTTFSAPSYEGQVEVLRQAQQDAQVSAVDYVEGHGTGTRLGDPLEVSALTAVLPKEKVTLLGSVKGNVGHLNTAAGVPGLLKALLMLQRQCLVPSLHAVKPSREVDWSATPLRLASLSEPWQGQVAAVSSFGVGGTNAHVLLKAAQQGAPVASGEVTWNRKPIQALLSSVARPSAQAAAPAAEAKGLEDWFYEEAWEAVRLSALRPTVAAVLLDGPEELPEGMPKAVFTTWQRAVPAAKAAGGFLIFLGTSREEPDVNDKSQERLILNCMTLIKKLTQSKCHFEVAFILTDVLRYAGLLGFLRSAMKEHPELQVRLLRREGTAPVLFPARAGEFLLTPQGSYEPRLRAVRAPQAVAHGSYERALVTGGLRGLGLRVAKWLADTGRAKSLVLLGRRAAEGANAALLEQLRTQLPVEVRLGDVSVWEEVEALPSCELVVHCAGAVKDGVLLKLSKEDVRKVIYPKIRGALHLRKRYPEAKKLAFSSSSGLFGVPGQSTYAAGNTFVDQVMPSIQWGGWGETGMVEDLGITPLPGERFIPVAKGLEALGRVLDGSERSVPLAVLDVHWPSFRKQPQVFTVDDPLLAAVEAQPPVANRNPLNKSWLLGGPGCRWRGSLQAMELCQQHVVSGVPVLPGSALLALAIEAAQQLLGSDTVQLQDVKFLMPLELQSARQLSLTASKTASGGSLRFSSSSGEVDSKELLHCTAQFTSAELVPRAPFEGELEAVEGIYDRFAAAGYFYGPDFQGHSFRQSETLAVCRLPSAPSAETLAPGALDVALQLSSLLHPLGMRGAPQGIRRFTARAAARLTGAEARRNEEAVDLRIFEDGQMACSVEGLVLASMHAGVPLKSSRVVWQEMPLARRSCWRVVGEEVKRLCLPEVTEKEEEPHEAVAVAVVAESLSDVLRCRREVQRLAARCRCWVLCSGCLAEAAAEAAVEVGAMALVGSAPQFKAISLQLGMDCTTPLRVVEEEGRLKLLQQVLQVAEPASKATAMASEPYVVEIDSSKASKGAQCRRCERRRPQKGQVEIQSSLWALNFRDVLVAVGAISANVGGTSLGLGGECYGTVTAVGDGVEGLSVGDLVIATPPDGMGSYLVADARVVTRAPAGMRPTEAVAGTCAYATAWLALHWMANIRPGERVLIHSAAGGVGLAALHLCQRRGCEVYATASTEEKRQLLRVLGAKAFHSRRVADFEEGILEATNGEGVDVVLNSLSGRAIPASLHLLRDFGRFVEIGKRDQYEGTQMELTPFLKGISYHAAHFDVLMLKRPEQCRKLLEEVWAQLPDLPRLPTKTFGMADLKGALEYFAKGIHIGKVLVAVEDGVPVLPARPEISGPVGDIVAQALRAAGSLGGLPVCCVERLEDVQEELFKEAQLLVTGSKAAAKVFQKLRPEGSCLVLPRWEPLTNLDDWLTMGGLIVASEDEPEGDLRGWLFSIVEEMAGPIEMDTTFEDAGLDSLSLISLARRLSSKVNKVISVADLSDNPTPRKLLQSFAGGPLPQVERSKALCLHGFRSNGDAMAAQLAPLISAMGGVEWIFLSSPRLGSGPSAPLISEGREWWGSGDFETGWRRNYEALQATLPAAQAIEAVGAVGFSQGGAVAALLNVAWRVLFSPVRPPQLRTQQGPCLLTYDPQEEYVQECREVGDFFPMKQVYTHHLGHDVPRDSAFQKRFQDFVSQQLGATP